jgi:predicted NAD/FAD-binding protein
MKKKLAVVGTGIAGMSAAYFLQDEFDVTLIEKNDYIGGHTNTIKVHDGQQECPMDTGFMVFNEKTYPLLVKLFKQLSVEYKNTDMSFSVRDRSSDTEYNGSSLNGIFSQRKNIFDFKFLGMVLDILKFNKRSVEILDDPKYEGLSIRDYITQLGLGNKFYDLFLVPMSSAVWSTPIEKMGDFPAQSLVRFFKNHGFVGVNTQLQWKTVTGGSIQYRNKLLESFKGEVLTNAPVKSVTLEGDKVLVKTSELDRFFDRVVLACHADESLEMIDEPTSIQSSILSAFTYQKNEAVVHTDSKVMPLLKENWSSWNFIKDQEQAYTVYYMNRLQGVSERQDFFININGKDQVDPKKIIKSIDYHHPTFSVESVYAQRKIDLYNQEHRINLCGSYYRYGFHEDALLSSVKLCEILLGRKVL